MCKAMEDMMTDYFTEEKKNLAVKMLKNGKMSEQEIAECLDFSTETIKELAEKEGLLVK